MVRPRDGAAAGAEALRTEGGGEGGGRRCRDQGLCAVAAELGLLGASGAACPCWKLADVAACGRAGIRQDPEGGRMGARGGRSPRRAADRAGGCNGDQRARGEKWESGRGGK